MVRLLRKAQYRILPWKNGQGITAEIAIHPERADFARDSFLWRLSSATVAGGGPFSLFPGYDRFLTILEGAGLQLDLHSRKQVRLLRPGEILRFSGDESVTAELVSGPVTDFNLFVRLNEVHAQVEIQEISSPRVLTGLTREFFLFALREPLTFEDAEGREETLSVGDTLRLQKADTLKIRPKESGSTPVALINLDW